MTDRQLEEAIERCAEEKGLNRERPKIRPITDGICDEHAYFSSHPRIMFILKEPYDEYTSGWRPKGGGWSITKDYMNHPEEVAESTYPTTYYVAKTAQAILERDFTRSRFTETKRTDAETYEILKYIAYINLSKMPADTLTGNDSRFREKYMNWKDIIHAQIKTYNPDVIVCGGTFSLLKEHEPLFNPERIEEAASYNNGSIPAYTWTYYGKERLVIDSYHPSAPAFGFDYMNGIRRAWLEFARRH